MSPRDFKKLEREWYERLKKEGFNDIEDSRRKGRPLKEYHSFDFPSVESELRRAKRQPYQYQIEAFRYNPMFKEIVAHVRASVGNLTKKQIEMIWDMHCEGVTERSMAQQFKCSKTKIHSILEKYKKWMNLV